MTDANERLRAVIERMKARSEDPTYQAHLARYEAEAVEPPEVRLRKAYRRMDIPEEHWDLLAQPDETEALRLVRRFLDGSDRFLLLAGTAGRGKTLAACWALAERGGRYARARDVAAAWGEEDEGWLADLANANLLVLDEMAREPQDEKGWAYSKVYDLLDRRQSSLRKTILVTNAGLDEWKARYCPDGRSDPLYDRILARGTVPKPLTGPSLRREP